MKKSILVAPALAVLLIGAAGSVGGTVAWFSSVSAATIETTSFAVARLDGKLEYELAAGPGTSVSNNVISLRDSAKLTHASYDHVNGVVSTLSSDSVSKLRSVGNTIAGNYSGAEDTVWRAKAPVHSDPALYYAVSWKITFTYEFATETAVNLYFDSNSVATASGANQTTFPGFRLALVAAESGDSDTTTDADNTVNQSIIWAPGRDNTEAIPATNPVTYNQSDYKQPKYCTASDVSDNSGTDHSIYDNASGTYTVTGADAQNLYLAGYHANATGNRIAEGGPVSSKDQTKGYIGTITKNATVAQNFLSYYVVVWYEGTDPAISGAPTDEQMSTVAATLKFYTREYQPE